MINNKKDFKVLQYQERIHFIDIAKGLGIWLVIIGHLNTNEFLHNMIYSFHMPFFFFLSGYLNKESTKIGSLIGKKGRTLLIPYLFFGLLSIFIMLFFKVVLNNPIQSKHLNDIIRITYYNGNPLPINKVIWFLMVLFWVEMFHFFLIKMNLALKLGISFVFGYFISIYLINTHIRLPFGIDIVPMALSFFYMGIALKKYIIKRISISKQKMGLIFLVAFCFLLFLNLWFKPNINMMNLKYDNPILLISSFIAGTAMLMCISKMINKNFFIAFYGCNSLIVLGLHGIVVRLSNSLMKAFDFYLDWYIIFLFVLAILYPLIKILNSYFPIFVGKTYKLKTL
ncbi:acyltransferase family protein [Thalassobellus citreus]|uniref:acyltransferase family protein n=1 Tax=Thalassobellus citreus TaxID=3367752 RepID=UPI0037B3D310